jgi:hypothetical protein
MNLSPLPVQRFYSNIGLPLIGGKLFTYAAGTTTKIATYQNSAGALNTNPVILNFRGEANVWLDPALTYKFVLAPATDTDPPTNPFWTIDNIAGAITYADITQTFLGRILYPRSSAEISASINPSAANLIYVYGDPRRSTTYRSGGWVNYGDVPTYISGTSISIPGDVTARYSRGRRVQTIGTSGTNESRILNAVFAVGVTTLTLINDISGNGGLLGAVPSDVAVVSLGVVGDLNTTNAWVQDSNAVMGQNFINKNLGSSAASRIVIGNYDSDSVGVATANTSAVALVATGGTYGSSYLPGMATGRHVIMHTGLDIDLNFGTWDTLRFIIPSENGTYTKPLVFYGALKTVIQPEGVRICAPSEPGNSYLGFYRSNETTRKGRVGFDSAGANNNMVVANDETTSTARILIQTAGNDISLISATDVQLAAGNVSTGWVKISNGLLNFANDAAAAAGGVPITGLYRNGSVVMIRVV